MGKLIVLKLEGDLKQQGFKVTLEIGNEENSSTAERFATRPWIEISGRLPANPELANTVRHHWLETYRSVGAPVRIKSKKITYDGFINERIQVCRESADVLRDRTTDWLDADSFKPIDRRLREELDRQQPARFLIRSDDPQLQKLPWHLWDLVERYPKAEVAFSSVVSNPPQPPQSENRNPKVRILAILGHSAEIDIEADRKLLENLPDAETVFLVEPKHQQLNDQLWEQPWDIIFFAGHSETQEDSGRIYINPNECLTVSELWYALRKAVDQGLKLAIFNSCDGLGLTRALDDLNIPQMIVMRELIPDQVAQEFLKYFLEAFSGGQPFYLSVRAARERLQGLESQYPCASWLPVICQNPAAMPLNWDDLRQQPQPTVKSPAPEPLRRQRPKLSWQQSLRRVALASVVATSLVLGVRSLGLLQTYELKAFDRLLRLRPPESIDDRFLIVTVGEADIDYQDRMGMARKGSLSDTALEQLLQKVKLYQPRTIGLNLYHDFEFDPKLMATLRQNEHFIGICYISDPGGDNSIAAPPGIPPKQLGFSDLPIDPDGVIRRQLLNMSPSQSCDTRRSFSWSIALDYLAQKGIYVSQPAAAPIQLGGIFLKEFEPDAGGYQLPPDEATGYQFLLKYRSSSNLKDNYPKISLRDLLNGSRDSQLADLVNDRIILIGKDTNDSRRFLTPYSKAAWSKQISAVFIQAETISQILSAVENRRPLPWWWSEWIEWLWIGSWSSIGGLLVLRLRSPLYLGITVIVALGVLNGLCFAFVLQGGWVPLVPAAIVLVATSGGGWWVLKQS